MAIKVYVVFHSDIEEGEFRAVFARREDAEAHVSESDWFDNWIIERAARECMANGVQPDDFRPAGITRWEYPVGTWHEQPQEAAWNFRYERKHHDYCCSVIETDLR